MIAPSQATEKFDYSAWFDAIEVQDVDAILRMINEGIDVDYAEMPSVGISGRAPRLKTALLLAAEHDLFSSLEVLLTYSSPNLELGWDADPCLSPLQVAVAKLCPSVSLQMIHAGAHIHGVDSQGATLLGMMCRFERPPNMASMGAVINALIDAGIDPDSPDCKGMSARAIIDGNASKNLPGWVEWGDRLRESLAFRSSRTLDLSTPAVSLSTKRRAL